MALVLFLELVLLLVLWLGAVLGLVCALELDLDLVFKLELGWSVPATPVEFAKSFFSWCSSSNSWWQ